MASKTIATILNLKDNFSETIKKTTQNTAAFAKEVKQAESSISKLKTGITGAFSSTGAKIAGIVGGLGIAEFARESLMLASDLNEVQNVVDTTFTDSASKINDFAKTTADQFGISELQAKKFSGTLGAMLKSAGFTGDTLSDMSTSLTGLTGDLASFYNLDPEEAFDKIKSGISGMTEPLRSIGVDVSETTVSTYALANGFTKQWKDATQAEKEMWRYKSIMSQTKDAQGDYAKTADSFANQLRTLKLHFMDLGSKIMSYTIPAFQDLFKRANEFLKNIDVKGFMDNMIQTLSNVKPYFDDFIGSLENLGNTIWQSVQPAIDWIKQNVVPDGWNSVGDAIESILTHAKDTFDFINNNWGKISNIVGGIALAVGGWKLALIGVNTWIAIVTFATKAWETIRLVIWGITAATSAWEAAQWALDVAMDANPVGAVTLLIEGLIFALYELITHWQEVKSWCEQTWQTLQDNPILDFIVTCISPWGEALIGIVANWNEIVGAIESAYNWFKSWIDLWNGTTIESKTATINTQSAYSDAISNPTGNAPSASDTDYGTNATGTDYWKGGWTKVGEHGTEMVKLPSGSKVYTNSQTKDMLGNKGVNVHVTIQGNVIGNEDFADYVGDHIMNRMKVAFINQ